MGFLLFPYKRLGAEYFGICEHLVWELEARRESTSVSAKFFTHGLHDQKF